MLWYTDTIFSTSFLGCYVTQTSQLLPVLWDVMVHKHHIFYQFYGKLWYTNTTFFTSFMGNYGTQTPHFLSVLWEVMVHRHHIFCQFYGKLWYINTTFSTRFMGSYDTQTPHFLPVLWELMVHKHHIFYQFYGKLWYTDSHFLPASKTYLTSNQKIRDRRFLRESHCLYTTPHGVMSQKLLLLLEFSCCSPVLDLHFRNAVPGGRLAPTGYFSCLICLWQRELNQALLSHFPSNYKTYLFSEIKRNSVPL